MGGLGEAISVRLHDAGYTVVAIYSPNKAGVRGWLDRMAAQGCVFPAYPVDVADYDSCQACVGKIQAEVGPVDILVNNAGITRDASFKKLDKESWDAVIRTNLDSVFNMTKPVCEGMVERGWGRIIDEGAGPHRAREARNDRDINAQQPRRRPNRMRLGLRPCHRSSWVAVWVNWPRPEQA